jgi:hypothetical protein
MKIEAEVVVESGLKRDQIEVALRSVCLVWNHIHVETDMTGYSLPACGSRAPATV